MNGNQSVLNRFSTSGLIPTRPGSWFYRDEVMWRNCFSRCSRPIGMKKLSNNNRCKVACHAHELTLFTGHKQRFIHTHLMRSPPIVIAKLSEVLMNITCITLQVVYMCWLPAQIRRQLVIPGLSGQVLGHMMIGTSPQLQETRRWVHVWYNQAKRVICWSRSFIIFSIHLKRA